MKAKAKVSQPVERYSANAAEGLTTEQVQTRISQNKTNHVKHTVGKSYFSIIKDNILTLFNLIGIVVFILMLVVGSLDNAAFFLIISANLLLGIFQEVRAKLMVQKLSIMTSPTAVTLRNGEFCEISTADLVLDDVIELCAGKQIPADATVLDGSIEANESLLTGESLPIQKQVGDTLLSGSFVVSGKCLAKVEHVGDENYVEQLTEQAKKFKKPKSQLMKSISGIIKIIGILVLPLGIATFLTAYIGSASLPWQEALKKACGSVIGMIPSGMVLLTSATLAVSVVKMAKRKALVQDLYSIEMLARVDCLCMDKTGTITDGTMKVEQIERFDESYCVEQVVNSLLNATGDRNDTAKALLSAFADYDALPNVGFMPFSSDRKMSAVQLENGVFVLGAPEFVMPNNSKISERCQVYTAQGFRTLLVAKAENLENFGTVTPIALIVLSDNIRPDAAEIVKWFTENDVEVKVISGDNPQTVSVIAGKVGIKNADVYLSLDGLTDEEVTANATKYTVFGRVKPHQKALLVDALKVNGKTVAMTGDGVNDILAMKKSDCAVAVASGSEAARSVAHIVLTDNKFAVMPKIVAEGRQVVNNIQNSSALFLMKTTMTILVTVFALIIGAVYPFAPKELFAIEFCVIGIPAFVLALRNNHEIIKGSFLKNTLSATLPKGIAMALSVMVAYLFGNIIGLDFHNVADQGALTTCAMLSMTYAGLLGLVALCIPFSITTLLTSVLAAAATTGFFPLYRAIDPLLTDTPTYLSGFNGKMVLFVLVTAVISAVIIAVGKVLEIKVFKKGEIK